MCGIVGYLGNKEAAPVLLDGLRKLEYRGYDSAGIVVGTPNTLLALKAVGKVDRLGARLNEDMPVGKYGIAHTRWATHGEPSEINAHPHFDCSATIALVHNGIIENYKILKEELMREGHRFVSATDSEVISHLIEKYFTHTLEDAVIKALRDLRGAYGLAVVSSRDPQKIVVVRNSSPLLIGIREDAYIIASDASAILPHTRNVLFLDDGEIGVVTEGGVRVVSSLGEPRIKQSTKLDWEIKDAERGGYPHFMLKEIMEQPGSLSNLFLGRLVSGAGSVKLGGLEEVRDHLVDINRLIITGCGSAYYAGLFGKYCIEEYGKIAVEVETASEFRYRSHVFDEHTALLAISQSGETADTLAAVREAKQRGILTLGIVNVVGSSLARETDAGIYTRSGPEIGVASTKAFTAQLGACMLFALYLSSLRKSFHNKDLVLALQSLPDYINQILVRAPRIETLAKKYKDTQNFFFIGRKYAYPIALEGALKLKEIAYIHAEGYSGGELKHGPLALIDSGLPTFGIALKSDIYEKTLSNLEEIKARKGPLILLGTEGDTDLFDLTKDIVTLPGVPEFLGAMLSVIPLQLFAYYVSVAKGLDPDKPRNLAKSVTVE